MDHLELLWTAMAPGYGAWMLKAGAEVEIITRGGIDWTDSETPGGGGGIGGALLRHLRPPSPIGPFPVNCVIQEPGLHRRMRELARIMAFSLSLRPTAGGRLQAALPWHPNERRAQRGFGSPHQPRRPRRHARAAMRK